jgi:preprotein translocase subunit SecF
MAERRAKARERRNVDRYASVPAFTEDMPIYDEDADPTATPPAGVLADEFEGYDEEAPPRRPSPAPEAMGRGRTVPTSQRQVGQSSSSGRRQPTRQPRSKRK